ncbi:histone-lysine N-methyltransferase SETMAR-like [Vespa mandarinia]|uniref:histone-lysine N-methyltransferase SETMAR-like n=1 Tax=Vespa mandarinia TaxID=7446 RepID=UPI001607BD47|nr:histone-lysine N-methyltransferase SETMAR-like [Vespa mandarinia]
MKSLNITMEGTCECGEEDTVLHYIVDCPVFEPQRVVLEEMSERSWPEAARHLNPPYSLDLSTTDFHLFKHLKLFLRAKQYENEDSLKNAISEFIDSEDQNFFKTGIYAFKSRWEKCIEVNGAYFG